MSDSFATPWTVACQTPLSVGFPRQNTAVGCHFLLQGIFFTQGSNSLPLSHLGNPALLLGKSQKLWCWRRLLRVPWTARRSNQSILKEISPGISLERMMLKLKLQYFGHLMQRVDSLEKTLMLWGIGGRRKRGGWDGWMASLTRWTWVWVNSGSWWWTGRPGVLWFMGSQRVGHDWETELNWRRENKEHSWQEEQCEQR